MTNEWHCRIQLWIKTLKSTLYVPMETISFDYFTVDTHLTYDEAKAHEYSAIAIGEGWGQEWQYGWFLAEINLADWAKGERIVVDLNIGGEATLYVNGENFGTRRDDWILEKHHFICDNYLARCAKGTERIELLAECYAGHDKPVESGDCATGPNISKLDDKKREANEFRNYIKRSTVGIWQEQAYHLYLETMALYEIWKNEDKDSLRAAEIEEALKNFTLCVEFEQGKELFHRSVLAARTSLQPILACQNGSTSPVIHAIGHAHIDLAWLWPLEETERKCARTMAAQLRHMEEYPDYKMILSQPYLFELIEQHYPSMFQGIMNKIAAGQLIPEGGMWVEADTNIPSGESLIRQFYYGKKYFKEKFHIDSSLLWLPDVFGYSGALPQIMKGCGMTHFTTHKIFWTYNGGEPFPYHYFNWKGIDGTGISTFIHVEYSSATNADTLINRWKDRAQKTGLKRFLQPFGYGDGGGGATRDHLENCLLFKDMEGVPKVIFDNPNHFFEVIEADGYEQQEYVGELYYQAHRGTYTSQAKTKQGNRQCEFALREAEMWNAIQAVGYGRRYPQEQLEENWKLVLLNQFHDILPGSAIHKVYQRAEQEYQQVLSACKKITDSALLDFSIEGEKENGITIYNSLSWNRTEIIYLPPEWRGATDGEGTVLPLQQTEKGFVTEVVIPSCGRTSLSPFSHSAEEEGAAENKKPEINGISAAVYADTRHLENNRLRLTLNECGEIISIVEKENNREWADGPCNRFYMYQDIPSHFEAWDIDSMYKEKSLELCSKAVITVLTQGAFVAKLKIEKMLNQSKIVQIIELRHDSDTVIFSTEIDWRETHKLLKTAFPVQVVTDELVSEIQFGMIKRPNHQSRNYDKDRFEVCNHKWSALMEANRGFALLNDSKYGISSFNNSMELTLLKSATFPDETADKGIQHFTYAFALWNTSFMESGVVKKAYELNVTPPIVAGYGETVSYFTVDCEHVILDTVKKDEHGEGFILRLFEAMGGSAEITLSTQFQIQEAFLTDMLEENRIAAEFGQHRINLTLKPYEIKTVLLVPRKAADRRNDEYTG